MSELSKRVLVAVVGIPTVVALLYLGGWFLALPLAAFAALGAHELYRLAAERGVEALRWVGVPGAAALVLAAAWQTTFTDFAPWGLSVLGLGAASVLLTAVGQRGPDDHPLAAVAVTVFGMVYAGLSLAVIPLLHALPKRAAWTAQVDDPWAGPLVLLLPLAATWCGDTFAFFAGSAWGKSKMAPTISPNKSWVGFWAALSGAGLAAGVWFVAVGGRMPDYPLGAALTVLIGAVIGLGGVVGDLAESLLKREAGVKDSGTFFPGHGGVLDRLDALLVTVPLAYVILAVAESFL